MAKGDIILTISGLNEDREVLIPRESEEVLVEVETFNIYVEIDGEEVIGDLVEV